ncbi:hypothetical protein J5N97_029115 [Dioscorea zingiberensis]|uniref:CCHC-type domain-containing protein n=1 Tax=Dioscorea zingiberensis TaxID=325984 RepID=A0A9D5H5J3_9LILI|nr:hypothetical protein J5N97_029115 [Dioscorea zingiberensis]
MKSEIIKRDLGYFENDENDEMRVYILNQNAYHLRQNGRPVSVYFGELIEIFHELDHYDKIAMVCDKDLKIYLESKERQRVYLFLGGLDYEYEQVRGEVLRKDPPLGLQAAYAYIRRESDRKEAMKPEEDKTKAMVARNRTLQGCSSSFTKTGSSTRFGSSSGDRSSRYLGKCEHCGKLGHSKQRCYELIGYPEGWDKCRDSRFNKNRAFVVGSKDDPERVAKTVTTLVSIAGYSDSEDDWLWH